MILTFCDIVGNAIITSIEQLNCESVTEEDVSKYATLLYEKFNSRDKDLSIEINKETYKKVLEEEMFVVIEKKDKLVFKLNELHSLEELKKKFRLNLDKEIYIILEDMDIKTKNNKLRRNHVI